MIQKVMLSAKFDPNPELAELQMRAIRFPVLVSYKIDGIRCHIYDAQALSRKNKLLPNRHVQRLLGSLQLQGLDGELTHGLPTSPTCFNTTQSAVMSQDGEPQIRFHVFDSTQYLNEPFENRLDLARQRLMVFNNSSKFTIDVVPHRLVENLEQLLAFEVEMLSSGWEGVMIRDPRGPYKQGRSTLREGWLIKMKRFEDSEAEILGCYEQETNTNEATINEVGRSKRSSHKDGKVANGHMGGFYVRDIHSGIEFDLGGMLGVTKEQRKQMWENFLASPSGYIGQIVKYKHQAIGKKEKPRIPIFLGFRSKLDM